MEKEPERLNDERAPDLQSQAALDGLAQFLDLPSRRVSLTGIGPEGDRLNAVFAIAKKPYTCQPCAADIQVGEEHIILQERNPRAKYDHHHVHQTCFAAVVLPEWKEITKLDSKKTTPTEMHRLARNARYRNRRRQR